MAKTATIFARVDPDVKKQAESILNELGIPMSNAIGIFLKQITIHGGIPFEIKIPSNKPVFYDDLTEEQLNKVIYDGMADIENGYLTSAKDVREEMNKAFNK